MTLRQQLFANNAKTTLSLPIMGTDTSITLVDASKFPSPTTGQYFLATLDTGTTVEIVECSLKTGNVLTVIRGRENTLTSSFPSGTSVEVRVTSDTLASFAKTDTRMSELSSVELLTKPSDSNGTSYVCASLDESGNPTVALKNTTDTWRFSNYPKRVFTGTIAASPPATLASASCTLTPSGVSTVITGKYLVQFTSGSLAGNVRPLFSNTDSSFTWVTDLPSLPVAGEQFEVYQSTTSVITGLEAALSASSDAIIYSILLGE